MTYYYTFFILWYNKIIMDIFLEMGGILLGRVLKYEVIMNDLIKCIENKEYAPGSLLPSENDLIQKYNVSRITIRRAIDELYRSGYIEKRQGKRGYVKELNQTQDITKICSYTEEILQHGMTPSRKLIKSCLRLPTTEEQNELHIDKADPVFYMERVIYADEKPLCYTETTLPYKIFRDIENCDFVKSSLYDIIENVYKIEILFAQLKFRAVWADKNVALLLDIEKNIPLLLSTACTFGNVNGETIPIELYRTYYLTDRFEYTLTNRRNG